ncbi:acetyl xylan esterase [Ascobolus immersus RN42]|uniref:Carboxylic ester hydrolase n=1 Tax=Ascobolus immersus RN42 TaxID=1160509 RepID=A0A3N4HUR7_ASCIM|nr:acetyl xylan esterase [Ascobolus immersus RN42]
MKFLSKLLLAAMALAPSLPTTFSATLQQVTNYGHNPGNVEMWYYIPDCIKNSVSGRPVVIALHYCQGTAHNMYAGAHDGPSFREMADKYGFVVLYPNSLNDPGNCWDVFSQKSLTRNGNWEPQSIINQVQYAVNTWNVDASKVFAIGLSSGAMMVNVLAALYPDKIAGGAVYAGAPFGCFAGNGYWNNACAEGHIIKTPQQWGDMVRNAYAYGSQRPKLQLLHNTPDEILHYNNMEEQIKQWTNVHGYSTTPNAVSYGSPTSAWTRRTYGDRLQGLTSTQYTHIFPIPADDTIAYFGIHQNAPTACTKPTPTGTAVPTSTYTSRVKKWDQCGGLQYNGPHLCEDGLTCQYVDPYYWQCKEPVTP